LAGRLANPDQSCLTADGPGGNNPPDR
jgi:hypothetical protein